MQIESITSTLDVFLKDVIGLGIARHQVKQILSDRESKIL